MPPKNTAKTETKEMAVASAGVVQDAAAIITVDIQAEAGAIATVLKQMSRNAAAHAKALNELQNGQVVLRSAMKGFATAADEGLDEAKKEVTELRAMIAAMAERISVLESTAVRRSELELLRTEVKDSVTRVDAKVSRIEKGDCPILSASIQKACTQEATKQIAEAISQLSAKVEEVSASAHLYTDEKALYVATDAQVALERASQLLMAAVQETQATAKKDTATLKTATEAALRSLGEREITLRETFSMVVLESLHAVRCRYAELRVALDTLFAVLCLDQSACHDLLEMVRGGKEKEEEGRTGNGEAPSTPPARSVPFRNEVQAALPSLARGPKISDSTLYEAPNTTDYDSTVRRLAALVTSAKGMQYPYAALDLRGAAAAAAEVAEGEAALMANSKRAAPVARVDNKLSLAAANEDPRVSYFSRSPHMMVMRCAVQREVQDRIAQLRSELQQDMVTELLDVQKELRGKVTSSRLAELLLQYRDHQLYSTVRALVQEQQELRNTKLDTAQYLDALRVKADAKALDLKADASVLTAQVAEMNQQSERLFAEQRRTAERVRRAEASIRNLHDYVMGGGGVYSAMQELQRKLGQSMRPELEEMRGDRSLSVSLGMGLSMEDNAEPDEMIPVRSNARPGEGGRDDSTAGTVVSTGERCLRDASQYTAATAAVASGRSPRPARSAPDIIVLTSAAGTGRTRPPGSVQPPPSQAWAAHQLRERERQVNHHIPADGPGNTLNASEASSAGAKVPLASRGSVMNHVAAAPMTPGQQAYAEAVGIEPSALMAKLQRATPAIKSPEARGMRAIN